MRLIDTVAETAPRQCNRRDRVLTCGTEIDEGFDQGAQDKLLC